MRVGVVGDGIAGRTLYRILKRWEFDVDLYGQQKDTKCKVRPCGFGTSASSINIISQLGISPHVYVFGHDNFIRINSRKIGADLHWINKPKILEKIATEVRYDKPCFDDYDLIVDATGVARYCSPTNPEFNDKKGIGYQFRVILPDHAEPAFDAIKGGYLWIIPLGEKEAHIGGGSTILSFNEVKQLVSSHLQEIKPNQIVCSCSGFVNLSGPVFPVVSGKFVKVGESAGLVIPFGGAGICTALESAMVLAHHIHEGDIGGYDGAIRRRFGWLRGVRKILDDSEKGRISFLSLGTSYHALRYQGLRPSLTDLLYIRRSVVKANN